METAGVTTKLTKSNSTPLPIRKVKDQPLQRIIDTQWLIRLFMQVKTHIGQASLPKLSGTGIISPLLNCPTTAYQNSLPF